jgi:hypothetical protein
MQPDPLPIELPIGTKISMDGNDYISLSVGKLMRGIGVNKDYYYFSSIENIITKAKCASSFYPGRIIWDELPTENTEENKTDLIINCKWCNKVIDNGMSICSSEVSDCQLYWDTLKERCSSLYIKPEDALEYDRASVKKFIDNRKK